MFLLRRLTWGPHFLFHLPLKAKPTFRRDPETKEGQSRPQKRAGNVVVFPLKERESSWLRENMFSCKQGNPTKNSSGEPFSGEIPHANCAKVQIGLFLDIGFMLWFDLILPDLAEQIGQKRPRWRPWWGNQSSALFSTLKKGQIFYCPAVAAILTYFYHSLQTPIFQDLLNVPCVRVWVLKSISSLKFIWVLLRKWVEKCYNMVNLDCLVCLSICIFI